MCFLFNTCLQFIDKRYLCVSQRALVLLIVYVNEGNSYAINANLLLRTKESGDAGASGLGPGFFARVRFLARSGPAVPLTYV